MKKNWMRAWGKGFCCLAMAAALLVSGGAKLTGAPWPIAEDPPAPWPFPLARAARAAAAAAVLLVNGDNPLPDDYEPEDLVVLYEQKRNFGLSGSAIRLREQTFLAANEMFKQANQDGVTKFTITSGFRTQETQEELYENDTEGTAALPGTSEHQTGLAFDVTTRHNKSGFEETEQFQWLSENCWDFGFIIRYPLGKEDITGIPYEPWHYRYVGVEIAQAIRDKGWTLEEYCEQVEE